MPFDNSPITGSLNRGGFVATADMVDRRKSELGMGYVLAASGVAVPHTGTAVETPLATIELPGMAMGRNGQLRITTSWQFTNSANNKTLSWKLGGSTLLTTNRTSQIREPGQMTIWNRGAEDDQLIIYNTTVTTTTGVDTSIDQLLTLTATLAVPAETITLEGYLVELMPSI